MFDNSIGRVNKIVTRANFQNQFLVSEKWYVKLGNSSFIIAITGALN